MFEAANASLLGNRKINQDRCSILSDEHCVLLMLSDGLGGHPKGEVAAQILMDTGRAAFVARSEPIIPNPHAFLERILQVAHDAILAFGKQYNPPIQPRATAVLALIQEGSLFWCHMGDSRLYLFREQQIFMRSRDHSVLESMNANNDATAMESLTRYRNLVTQCLGSTGREFMVQRNEPVRLQPFDKILLCTDGVWGQFTDEILNLRMHRASSIEKLTSQLVKDADHIGAPHSDNATLIILQWLDDTQNDTVELIPKVEVAPVKASSVPRHKTRDQNNPKPGPVAVASNKDKDKDKELQDAISTLLSAIDEFS